MKADGEVDAAKGRKRKRTKEFDDDESSQSSSSDEDENETPPGLEKKTDAPNKEKSSK